MKTDHLLACLAHLTVLYGRSKSSKSLTAGIPEHEGAFQPSQFIQAAKRAHIRAELVTGRDLKSIPETVLPCVALLQDGASCLILALDKDNVKIWNPKKKQEQEIPLANFKTKATGEFLFVKPMASFHDRTEQGHEAAGHQNWFRKTVLKNYRTYTKVLLASALINLFALASPIYIMNVYDRVIPNNAIATGWALSFGVLIIFAFDFVIRTLRGYFVDFAGRNIDVQSSQKLFDQILDIKLAHRPRSSGAYANTLREFDAIRDFLTSATLVAMVDLPFSLLFIFVIFVLAQDIGLIVLALMAVSLVVSLLIQIPLAKHVRNATRASEIKHGLLVESIYGLEGIKATNAEGKVRAQYTAHVAQSAKESQESRFYSALSVNASVFIQQISVVFIVLTGTYMIADLQLLTGALIACVMLSSRALTPVTQVANLMSRYHQAKQSFKQLNAIMALPTERPAGQDFLHRDTLDGHITFENVSFTYPETNIKVLDNINFKISPGERVGLIGRIGSGKSTIARLMVKLYEPEEGAILFDQTDGRQIDPADLRNKIAYIPQDVTLMRGTVRDNITMGYPQASEEDIIRASKAAGAHDFIGTHPHGYDLPVGERGEGLSGGQKQAIALARALLIKPNIFVCDEPTNAMDMQSESHFAKIMQEQTKDKTFILITHRMSLLPLVDRLILIEKGKIVADGPRDDVIAALSKTQPVGDAV